MAGQQGGGRLLFGAMVAKVQDPRAQREGQGALHPRDAQPAPVWTTCFACGKRPANQTSHRPHQASLHDGFITPFEAAFQGGPLMQIVWGFDLGVTSVGFAVIR